MKYIVKPRLHRTIVLRRYLCGLLLLLSPDDTIAYRCVATMVYHTLLTTAVATPWLMMSLDWNNLNEDGLGLFTIEQIQLLKNCSKIPAMKGV